MIYVFVAILVFAAVATLVAAMAQRRQEGADRNLRARVGTSELGGAEGPVMVERDTRMSTIPFLDTFLKNMSVARRIELFLYQAGMSIKVATFVLIIAACAMGAYLIAFAIFGKVLNAVFFLGVGGFLPVLFVGHKKSARMRAFAEEFPDTLDLLVSALRAGISFSGALQIVRSSASSLKNSGNLPKSNSMNCCADMGVPS